MDKVAKIQYLKQIVEELEEELVKEVNTKKDDEQSINLLVASNATANDLDELSPFVCEEENQRSCWLKGFVIVVTILSLACIGIFGYNA